MVTHMHTVKARQWQQLLHKQYEASLWQNLSPDSLNCNVRQQRNKVASTIKKEWAHRCKSDLEQARWQMLQKTGGLALIC